MRNTENSSPIGVNIARIGARSSKLGWGLAKLPKMKTFELKSARLVGKPPVKSTMLVPSCDLSGRFETIASRVMSQPGSPGSAAQRWGSSPQHQERALRGDNNGEDGMGTDSTCKQSDPQHPRFLGSSESAA